MRPIIQPPQRPVLSDRRSFSFAVAKAKTWLHGTSAGSDCRLAETYLVCRAPAEETGPARDMEVRSWEDRTAQQTPVYSEIAEGNTRPTERKKLGSNEPTQTWNTMKGPHQDVRQDEGHQRRDSKGDQDGDV